MREKDSYRFPFPAYPAVRIMLLMMTGIALADLLSLPVFATYTILFITVMGWVLVENIRSVKLPIFSSHSAIILYSILIVTCSMVLVTLQQERLENQLEGAQIIDLYEWEDLIIKGEITEKSKSRTGRNIYTIEVHETKFTNDLIWKEGYRMRLYADTLLNADMFAGDIASLKIRVYPFPEQRNPIGFNYGNWLRNKGISAHGDLQRVIVVDKKSWFSFVTLQGLFLKNIDKLFAPDAASLAKALLIGHKEDLTQETRQYFARAGLSHIMAVSGMHVGFLIAPFWLLIPYLWYSNRWKWFGLLMLTIVLLLYAGITGFSPSVNRASLMAWLLTYGRLFYKKRNSINLTAVAAIILLLIDPKQLFDAGFQLSFTAVFIILLVMPEARRLIPQRYTYKWSGKLMTTILVSIVVQLGLFPILALYFGEFSIVGPISNALVVPFLSIIVPMGLCVVASYSLLPHIIVYVSPVVEYGLEWVNLVANSTGDNSYSYIGVEEISVNIFLIWIFAVFTISSLRIPTLRWKMAIGLLLATNLFMVEQVIKKTEPKKLVITFLDVGQGDAIHIKTPNNKNILVDAGRWTPGSNSGEEVIIPYLAREGIQRLDGVLLSHQHADHIGGMEEIIETVKVDAIYQPSSGYNSQLAKRYMKRAIHENIYIKEPVAGDIIHIDPSIRIFIVGPESYPEDTNINNRSLAFKLVYGNTSALFSGDAEKEQELQIASKYGPFLNSDLYKVGHHGSNTSSNRSFMEYIQPNISVASLAFNNRFKHPGSDTVSRLHKFGNEQHYTSLSGAIIYESDGSSFNRVQWK